MPSTVPSPGSKILVTGASGFIAVHVVKSFVDNGYKVVGTVRSKEKGDYLKDMFKGDFEYVLVEDIAKADAFDEVLKTVKGIEGIAHTASPFHLKADDPEELIRPAVDGTVNILNAAHRFASDVKRVVITSSVASVMVPADPPKTFTEKDWNTFSPKNVEEKGKDAEGGHKYRASKVLAERASWKFMEDEKPSFGLATICPPFVFGPILHQVDKPENLNTSVANFYNIMTGGKKKEDLPGPGGNWIDVREVAEAHYKALTTESAAGNRFIISAGPFCAQDLTDYLLTVSPPLKDIPKGDEGAAAKANDPSKALVFSGAKAEKELGIKYRGIQECAKDMYESIRARGW